MDKKESKRDLVTKGVMGLLVGVSLMLADIWAGHQLHIVWNIWPSTDGEVVRGTVQDVLQVPFAKGGMPTHVYTPKVEFRYTAGGRDYTTEAPSVHTADTFAQAAANLTRLYAPGTHHPIRYNPRDPREIRFGTIEFGPLAFASLLLIFGSVLLAMGAKSLLVAHAQLIEPAPAKEREIRATVLPFADRARPTPSAATLICPSCGRRVNADEETCPNCLKALRAA